MQFFIQNFNIEFNGNLFFKTHLTVMNCAESKKFNNECSNQAIKKLNFRLKISCLYG